MFAEILKLLPPGYDISKIPAQVRQFDKSGALKQVIPGDAVAREGRRPRSLAAAEGPAGEPRRVRRVKRRGCRITWASHKTRSSRSSKQSTAL